jgi:hypothetical protein
VNGDVATTDPSRAATDSSPLIADASTGRATAFRGLVTASWDRIERFLVDAGDWLNPILVKETRQALKSYQFTATFVLVLVACWVVTIGGVAVIGPRIFYSADGGTLLWWYYAVLAFPLMVVVPYGAFRSLASEREDNTYELLSITTLKPRQIISGKLASSVVQMAVYFSAITPCIAFTYLLRGVDVPTIAVLLAYTFIASLGLSMIGILFATIGQQRFTQVFVSVALVAFLLCTFYVSLFDVATIIILYNWVDDDFWIGAAALATLYITTFSLAFLAATAMVTFASENRSTPVRIGMLVQQAAFVGWMGYAWIQDDFQLQTIAVLGMFAAFYWYVMGALLSAERPGMSQRVKRRLPTSLLGRALFTWLIPGPASGYMFVVANAMSIVVIAFCGMIFASLAGKLPGVGPTAEDLLYLLIIGWSYLVAYLGLGILVVAAVRRVAVVTMLASVLIHFLVVLAGGGIPTAVQLMSVEMRFAEYSRLQITNPIWTLKHLATGGVPLDGGLLIMVVPTFAACMLLLNMRSVVRELQEVRIAPPPRVLEDEAELHPPPASLPINPWDEA